MWLVCWHGSCRYSSRGNNRKHKQNCAMLSREDWSLNQHCTRKSVVSSKYAAFIHCRIVRIERCFQGVRSTTALQSACALKVTFYSEEKHYHLNSIQSETDAFLIKKLNNSGLTISFFVQVKFVIFWDFTSKSL
jgi:hypothetical protein